ncbi:DUF3592 domain-containing protein [Flavobacterium sp. ACN2]|uniref:DUF3592 domain-containing protein n=1 Tax=Flavobacterium sp. ACN2 TaxID=1975676 RepID=UPI000BB36BA8|nr:DUF3592 domain-containing protein [Flavobacterium sp. ACN2]
MKIKTFLQGWGCGILFLGPFVIVGLGTLFFSFYTIIKGVQAENWIQVPANIEKVDMNSYSRKGSTSYEVAIKYSYVIGAQKYWGNRIGFGYGLSNVEDHDTLFLVLKESKRIMVYVDPDDNKESIVIPGVNDSIMFTLIFSILWNSLLLFLIFLPLIAKSRNRNIENSFILKYRIHALIIIWVIGLLILLNDYFHINIENKINVIERTKNIDSNTE